jgi:hypothetical protein
VSAQSRLLSSAVSDRLWVRVLGACVLAGSLLCSSAARAQDDPTITAAARERFQEGVAHFDKKEFEKARAAFLQAYALKKHPVVLLNLAQSEVRSGHERDAAKHFTQFLREATDASAAQRESAQAGLATARQSLIEVVVSVDEPGAEILVDGTSEGTSPLSDPLFLDPGSHSVEAKKGGKTATQSVSGKAGERKEARLLLSAPPPAAAAPSAEAKPEDDGSGEPAEVEVSTGGREPFLRWVTTRPAGLIPASATILLGLGAGGFAIGSNVRYSDADSTAESIDDAAQVDQISTQGICVDPEGKVNGSTSVPADEKPSRIQQYKDACQKHQDYVDQGDTFKTVAIGLGVGAGVAAVATVVLYFTTAPKTGAAASDASSSPEVAVLPWATTASGGLAVFGRF